MLCDYYISTEALEGNCDQWPFVSLLTIHPFYRIFAMPQLSDAAIVRCRGYVMPPLCDAVIMPCRDYAMPGLSGAVIMQ